MPPPALVDFLQYMMSAACAHPDSCRLNVCAWEEVYSQTKIWAVSVCSNKNRTSVLYLCILCLAVLSFLLYKLFATLHINIWDRKMGVGPRCSWTSQLPVFYHSENPFLSSPLFFSTEHIDCNVLPPNVKFILFQT